VICCKQQLTGAIKIFFSENPANAFEFTAKEVILTVKTNIQYQTGR
jgi:hypothetical protein